MSQAPGELEISQVWSAYWSSVETVAPWDSLSEMILGTLEEESAGFSGSTVMEAGCGTGRISREIASAGAAVTCLDITSEALDLARTTFGNVAGRFVQGSILDLPKDGRFDLVWNAGVLEHFTVEDQRKAIEEFLSVLEQDGRVVILTPNSKSPLYRLAKWILEFTGRWPYGVEIPKSTLRDCMPEQGVLEREYTMALLPLILDSYKFVKPLRAPLRLAWRLLRERSDRQRLLRWDRQLSRWLGGYLLVSVIRAKD